MTSLGNLTVGIGLDTAGLISGFALAQQHISGFAGVAAGLLAGVGVAAIGMGVASVKAAGSFQESMTSLVTGAGESQKNLKLVSDGILAMAPQVGSTTKQLADGMYTIESAGYHGAQGLEVLKASAEGAKVGNADLASVANGVTTALTDYHLSADQASSVTNDLIATVAAGKTHMQDLATAMSTILPTAAAVGVSLGDTSAAMATMTGEGTNAAAAATYLRQLLMALESPAKKGADALHSIGLSTQQVSDEMKVSLPDTLQMITDALAKKFPVGSAAYIAALKDIAGGSRQMQGILELTGSHLQVFQSNLASITDTVKKGGDSIAGWNLVQEDFTFKIEQAKAAVETLGIKVGTALLPVVGQLFGAITPLIARFSDWTEKSGALQAITNRISDALHFVSSAFHDVFEPVQKVTGSFTNLVMTAKPLLDTFDRATALVPKVTEATKPIVDVFVHTTLAMHQAQQVAQPLLDTFDRATAILPRATAVMSPLLDTFDRATSLIPKTTMTFNPFLGIVNQLKPMAEGLATTFTHIGNALAQLGTHIADTITQNGLFHDVLSNVYDVVQAVGGVIANDIIPTIEKLYNAVEPIVNDFLKWNENTHFLQNTLSQVGQFIRQVGNDLASNLLPQVRTLLSNLETWLTKSNAVHDALGILGTVVDKTSGLVGTLIGWIADLVGWFAQSEPRANALKDVLFGIGGIIATMKIVEFGQNVYSMGMQAKDAATHFLDLAGTIKDKLVDAFNSLTGKARDAGTAVDDVGTRAKTAESNVKTAATESETDIEGIGTAAETTGARVDSTIDKSMAEMSRMTKEGAAKAEADIEGIGVAAQTTEGEVATASTEMEGELGIIGEEAVVASGEVSNIGTAAEDAEVITATASAGMKSSLGGVLGLLGLIGTVGIASFQAVKGNNPLSDIQKGDIGGLLGYLAGLTTGAGQLANGIDALQEGWGKAFGNMNTSASTNSAAIKSTVDSNLSSMSANSLFSVQSLSNGAIANLKKMGDYGKGVMQSLDQTTIAYWNDIAAYTDRMSANTAAAANRNLGTIHAPRSIAMGPDNTETASSDASVSHFATGGMAPGGSVLLGEFGPEQVDLPQGSIIHSTGSTGGVSGSSGGGPTTLILEIDGRQFAAATVDHIAPAVVNRMRLRVGTRV